jgi:CDP-diacylglycerol--glycerol-3-phosphate 3-phosphatidyltransferase
MVIGMLVVMCASDMYASVRAVLVWVTLIVILRELAITSLRLLVASSEQKIVVAASWLGKVKTVSQIAAILVMILEPIIWSGNIASWITVCFMGVMTLWSGIDYLKSYVGFIDPNE